MDPILTYLQSNQSQMLNDLELLVRAESPSNNKEMVDRCGETLQELFRSRLGLEAEVRELDSVGNQLKFTFGSGDTQVLIIAHFDTVWDVGRLNYRLDGNKAYGPGILDMKGGLIQAIWAMKACQELSIHLQHKVVFLCTTDEEIGSRHSRAFIEEEALRSKVVFVPEPAESHTGALKTSRKSVGSFKIQCLGKSSHAGNHHDEGINAIEEMAHQIVYVQSLTDYSKGTTISVGIVNGGSKVNMVPDQAECIVDVRVSTSEEEHRITSAFRGLQPHLKGSVIQVSGGINRPAMERTAPIIRLFEDAVGYARELGFDLKEAAAGGGSDGSFTSALGIPTLDGIGSVGDGPHAEYEHILIDQLPIRSALLAKLVVHA